MSLAVSKPHGVDSFSDWKRRRDVSRIFKKVSTEVPEGQAFADYLEDTYGVRVQIDSITGGYTHNYLVTDETKHTLFLLKYL